MYRIIIFASALLFNTFADHELTSEPYVLSKKGSNVLAESDNDQALKILLKNIQNKGDEEVVSDRKLPTNATLSDGEINSESMLSTSSTLSERPQEKLIAPAFAFGIFGAIMGIANFISGITQGALSRETLAEIKEKLQTIENKIDQLSEQVKLILLHQSHANNLISYGDDVQRLEFLLKAFDRQIRIENGLYIPAEEAHRFAEAALSLSSDGLDMVLENFHKMIMGGQIFSADSVFITYINLLDNRQPSFTLQVQAFAEYTLDLQAAGYALWIQASEIESKDYVPIQALLRERAAEQSAFLSALTRPWPSGEYGLPKTSSGCPANQGFEWMEGSRYQDNEDDDNINRIPSPEHFGYGSNRIRNIRQHFCMKYSGGHGTWPLGNYCIYQAGGDCPSGFHCGWILWDDEDSGNENSKSGYVPHGNYDHNTRIYYACRDDGPWWSEMSLPADRPFYLFRHTGPCQRVRSMSVNEEVILWDDEDDDNINGWGGPHPLDTGTRNHELHFCYYHPN